MDTHFHALANEPPNPIGKVKVHKINATSAYELAIALDPENSSQEPHGRRAAYFRPRIRHPDLSTLIAPRVILKDFIQYVMTN